MARALTLFQHRVARTPNVVLMGQTGAGKSSLFNAMLGQAASAVSDVAACTRLPVPRLLRVAGQPDIRLVDLPGLGESLDQDEAYATLYADMVSAADLVIWVVKADSRSLGVDEEAFIHQVQPQLHAGAPVMVVLSQADKMEPCRDWDVKAGEPGFAQKTNLSACARLVSTRFGISRKNVVAVSVHESWQGDVLMARIRSALAASKACERRWL